MKLFRLFKELLRKYYDYYEPTVLGAQRLFMFDVVGVVSLFTTTLSILTRTTHPITILVSMGVMAVTVTLLVLYHIHRIHLRGAATALMILLQLQTSLDQVTLALLAAPDSLPWIMVDTLMALMLIMISLVAFLRYSPVVVSILAIASFVTAIQFYPDPVLITMGPFFVMLLIAIILFDIVSARNTLRLQEENEELKEEVYEFFKVSGMSREQMKAYISLVKESGNSTESTRQLLNYIDSSAQKKILSSVKAVMDENASRMELLERAFPTLSRSQLSIVQLVLQGKKLSEICFLLGKNESNVSSQRSRIRTELHLGPEDDLAEALTQHLQAYLEKRELFQ
ncbi:MAG: response regulator transcription factor [Bacteroidales bacterium]|nr:response regulator transcription factor [Bacteroidales bacterium]MBQ9194730.1 response regulator transcription factor [Bacteroidales bacterium]